MKYYTFGLQHLNNAADDSMMAEWRSLHELILVPNLDYFLHLEAAICAELEARSQHRSQHFNNCVNSSNMQISSSSLSVLTEELFTGMDWMLKTAAEGQQRVDETMVTNAASKFSMEWSYQSTSSSSSRMAELLLPNKITKMDTEMAATEPSMGLELAKVLGHQQQNDGTRGEEDARLNQWRQDYFAQMCSVFSQKRIQPRNIFSRKKYNVLVERLRKIETQKTKLATFKLSLKYRLVRFPLDEREDGKYLEMLAEKRSNRLFLCVDQLFDMLHQLHKSTRHGRSISMYSAAKKKFANVTVECILKFLEGCQECKQLNKNEKKLNTLLAPNPNKEKKIRYEHFFDFAPEQISCRHCTYRKVAHQNQKWKNSVRSHLKKHHPVLLTEWRMQEAANGQRENHEMIDMFKVEGENTDSFLK